MKRLALVLVSILVALVVLDLVVGRVLIEEDGTYKGNPVPPFEVPPEGKRLAFIERMLASKAMDAPPSGVNGFDPELGWTNYPGQAKRGKMPIMINSIGARGEREYADTPPPDVLRVACYGESFTFGTDVEDDESWPYQLEQLDPRIEALNQGVGGYGTDQALLRSRRRGFYGARVATLGVMLKNVARNVNRLRTLLHPDAMAIAIKPRFILAGDGLELLPHGFATRREAYEAARDGTLYARLEEHEYWSREGPLLPSSILRILAAAPAAERRGALHMYRETEAEPFLVMVRVIEAFVQEARAAGVEEVLVIVFPTRADLSNGPRTTPYWHTLLDWMDAHEVDWLDVSDALLADEQPVGKLFATSHLGKRGNGIVARAVLERLQPLLSE